MNNREALLLVDHEKEVLDDYSSHLRAEGYRVLTATSGNDALAVIREQNPGAIVMEIMISQPDGFEICRQIRKSDNQVLIAFMSRFKNDDAEIHAFNVGADMFIKKPVSPRLLIRRLKALLRRN